MDLALVLGTSGIVALVLNLVLLALNYFTYRATQKERSRQYLSRFLLSNDFLQYLGGFSAVAYLLHRVIELKIDGSTKVFDPTKNTHAKPIEVKDIRQLQLMISKMHSIQESRMIKIMNTGGFVVWPKQLYPKLMKAYDRIDDAVRTPEIDIQDLCAIAQELTELEDEVRETLGLTILDKS